MYNSISAWIEVSIPIHIFYKNRKLKRLRNAFQSHPYYEKTRISKCTSDKCTYFKGENLWHAELNINEI